MEAETKKKLPALALGLVLGLLIGFYLPSLLTEHFAGDVIGKRKTRQELMVMISMPQGEVLATFTENIEAIDFLVKTGDKLELGLNKYVPLVTDPPLVSVTHPEDFDIEDPFDSDLAPRLHAPKTSPPDTPDDGPADDESAAGEPAAVAGSPEPPAGGDPAADR